MSSETTEPVDTWFETQFRDRYQEHVDKLGRFNLAIFGKSGVGKSTLINAVFGEDLAETGIGVPVTQEGHLYLSSAGFLGLYDTRGIEIGKHSDAILKEVDELISSNKGKAVDEQIHAVWYCVSGRGTRIEPTEEEFIRHLHKLELPVILVMTRVELTHGEPDDEPRELAEKITRLDLPIEQGRPILVMAKEQKNEPQHGLQGLLDATFRVVPEAVRDAFTAAQRIDLDRKRKKAAAAVAATVATAAATAVVPIPIAASAVLVPLQVGMIAAVSVAYGVKPSVASTAVTILPAIATGAGKTAVVSLLKLVPGAGSVIGGAINAATAGVLTGAMGYAWSMVCERIVSGGGEAIDSDILRALFNAEFATQVGKLLTADSGRNEDKMTRAAPTVAGWYPDPDSGGTRYWDGTRWTGDARPRRRAFAAASHDPMWAGIIAAMLGGFALLLFGGFAQSQNVVYLVIVILLLLGVAAAVAYFLRGQGPTTQAVEARLAAERGAANAKRRTANLWGVVAGFERVVRPRSSSGPGADAAVAQVDALSNPATAQSIQNLQKLLYTRAITDAEFEAAKQKLVGKPDDSFAQITKLAELHEAGILGDVEFAAAKAKALGL